MGTVANVSSGKPSTSGAVHYGLTTLTLPTSADATLAAGYADVGYISEDGVVNANTRSSESVKAWGGDTVLNSQNEKTDRFTFTMLEILNTDVLKVVHGASNVTGTLTTGIAVEVNAEELEYHAWVIDMIMKGGVLHRITLPYAKIIEIAEVSYTDTGATGYQVTVAAEPDSSGNTHYEYFKKPA